MIIDLRPDSPSFTSHFAVVLTADNKMVYVPAGFAHGFQTLADRTELFYQVSEFHAPAYARGVRWNDPAFGIRWPDGQRVMADRDLHYPGFRPALPAIYENRSPVKARPSVCFSALCSSRRGR